MESKPISQNVSVNHGDAGRQPVQGQSNQNTVGASASPVAGSESKASEFAKTALDAMQQAATDVLHFAREKGAIIRDFLFSHPESGLYVVGMAAGLLACCCHAFPLTAILTWGLIDFMGDCLCFGLVLSTARLMCEAVSAKIAERVLANRENMEE